MSQRIDSTSPQTPQQPQSIPDPSAQGNQPPSNAASNGATQPQTDPQTVTPPASAPASSVPQASSGYRGAVRFEDLSPDVQAFCNSANGVARREGEATGRRDAENAANNAIRDLTTRAESAERERDSIRLDFWRLKAALKVGLPNPVMNALRLRGDTEAELEQDAQTFLADLQGRIPSPEIPPVTPQGGNEPPAGDSSQPPASTVPVTIEQATEAQRASGEYDII